MSKAKKDNNTTNIVPVRLRNHEYASKYINDDWGTIAFKIPRDEIQLKFEDAELRFNCIYFLTGLDGVIRKVYVGQAKKRNNGESVLARLREHGKITTDWYCDIWNTAIVLTNKNGAWSLDDLNAVEHAFYNEIPLEHSLNGNNPNSGGADYSKYTDKIKQVKDYMIALGYKIFTADESAEDSENIQIMPEINDNAPVEDLQHGMARIPEIVTPHKVVKVMCDILPPEVWNDQTAFIDPACKGGEYLREIYDRLMDCELLQAKYPNETARSNHILIHQIYGIALSNISKERTKSNLNEFDINIRVIPNYIRKLKGIGLGSRPDGTSKTMQDILNEEFNRDMKIDVVIGNPPYQENTTGRNAKPLYNYFVTKLMPISNRFLSFIIPSRWLNGGIGLDDFRENIIHNKSVKYIKDFKLSDNVFKGVIISGGVMYFLMDKFYSGKCIVEYDNNDICTVSNRYLDEYEIYIRDNQSVKIIDKIKAKKYVDTIMSNLNPFGIDSDVRGYKEPNQIKKYKLLSSGGYGFISKFEVSKGCEYMPFYKTVVAKALSSKEGKILGTVEVIAPNEFCTFSYFIAGCFTSKEEANNLRTYLKSKFTSSMSLNLLCK